MESIYLCKGCFAEKGISDKCQFCGFNEIKYTAPSSSLHLGTHLNDRYITGKVLGSGGFGITYIAYDTKLEYAVAIKEYLPKELAGRSLDNRTVSMHSEDSTKEFQHYMDSFIREAKILAKFNSESGIVSVQDIFKENGTVYIVMYYVNGVTLEEYLAKNGNALPPEKVVQIMSIIMESLKKVHEAGVIHRDISPDNIYITTDNKVKLLDFGAARYYVANEKSTVSVVLKRGYAPLEQYYNKKENQGPWTDIYSIAATMYRAITGVKPPEALERMEQDELRSLGEMGIQVPFNIENSIMKGLSIRYSDRPKSLNEFIGLLEPDKKTEIIGNDRTVLINRKSRVGKKKPNAMLLIGLPLVAAIILVSLLILKPWQTNNQNDPQGDTLAVINDTEVPSSSPSLDSSVSPSTTSTLPADNPALDTVEPSAPAESSVAEAVQPSTLAEQPEGTPMSTPTSTASTKPSQKTPEPVNESGNPKQSEAPVIPAPDLVGLTLYQATNKCLDLGVELNISSEEYSDTVAQGLVISQNPAKGSQIGSGRIDVVMSKGEELVSVPMLTGMSEDEVKNIIERTGLTLEITYTSDGPGTVGSVSRQEPVAGSKINEGGKVKIYVYNGSATVTPSDSDSYIAAEFNTAVTVSGGIPRDGKTTGFFNVKVNRSELPDSLKGFKKMSICSFDNLSFENIKRIIMDTQESLTGVGDYDDTNGYNETNRGPYNLVMLLDENSIVLGYYIIK